MTKSERIEGRLADLGPRDRGLVERAARLVFGVFGFAGYTLHGLQGGGSGIVVAPGLAITAKHIMDSLYRQLEEREPPTWAGRRYHEANLFQVLDPFKPDVSPTASWRIESECRAVYTDLALLGIEIGCPRSESLASEQANHFFEWYLDLPPAGAVVSAIGYPDHSVAPEGEGVRIGAPFTYLTLEVSETYPRHHSAGMYDWPGFLASTESPINRGLSGGPVFYHGQLCGLVAGEWPGGAYVTSLGPLAVLDYTLGEGDKEAHRFSELFDQGVIVASDWPAMRDRIIKVQDEFGNPRVSFGEIG